MTMTLIFMTKNNLTKYFQIEMIFFHLIYFLFSKVYFASLILFVGLFCFAIF